jgi:hypothetical protein
MKWTVLEKKPAKITGYRVYVKVSYMKRKRNWHSWQFELQADRIHQCETYLKITRHKGTFRIARLREDGSIEWLTEVTR